MFQIIANYKNRKVLDTVSLEDYVDMMKNPDRIQKAKVNLARSYDKSDSNYKQIKSELPCIIFNFTHDKVVNASTIIKPTNYLYIDFDACDKFDFSKFPFIAAGWYSLSETGIGILVKCSGLTTENIKQCVSEISSIVGMQADTAAISKDRVNVIGYDNNIYYNNKAKEYSFNIITNDFEFPIDLVDIKLLTKKDKVVSHNTIIDLDYRLGMDDTTSKKKIRFSNYKELIANLDFNGDVFIDLGDNKLEYAEVIIPKTIQEGNRNQIMFALTTQLYGLNSWLTDDNLFSYMSAINKDKFHPPLKNEELYKIVNNVFDKEKPVLILNKIKRIIFNPDYTLNGKDKIKIAVTHINKKRGEENTAKIITCIDNWNFEVLGTISQSKLARETSFGIATIKRKYKELKNIIEIINSEYCISQNNLVSL